MSKHNSALMRLGCTHLQPDRLCVSAIDVVLRTNARTKQIKQYITHGTRHTHTHTHTHTYLQPDRFCVSVVGVVLRANVVEPLHAARNLFQVQVQLALLQLERVHVLQLLRVRLTGRATVRQQLGVHRPQILHDQVERVGIVVPRAGLQLGLAGKQAHLLLFCFVCSAAGFDWYSVSSTLVINARRVFG
jgi:hypothetical protein